MEYCTVRVPHDCVLPPTSITSLFRLESRACSQRVFAFVGVLVVKKGSASTESRRAIERAKCNTVEDIGKVPEAETNHSPSNRVPREDGRLLDE